MNKKEAIALGAIAALGLLCCSFGWWGPLYQLAMGMSQLALIVGLAALLLLAAVYRFTRDLPSNLGGMIAAIFIAVAILAATLFVAGPVVLQLLK